MLVDGSYKFHKAIVDVANGKVLLNQQIPLRVGPQSMAMMMHHDMMGPEMMFGTIDPTGGGGHHP